MTALRLTDAQRLDVLAAAVLDHLDETHTEGDLEAGGSATDLYNLAAAMRERRSPIGHPGTDAEAERHADELATHALAEATAGTLKPVRDRILENLGDLA